MFYRILKEFFLKKVVSKGLLGYKLEDSEEKIKTIGILVDESEILNRDTILRELKSYNLEVEAIEVLVFKEKIKNKEVIQEPFYTLKDLSLSGKINKLEVQKFIEADFDLLINFYEEPKASLNVIAKKSKAKFKVGFSTIDKRINHLIIDCDLENVKVFTSELVKYLRILNKV
ncbi:DUF6913 domain-containing protein [Flavobacterium okayamense]|uniref:Uncharacterized protein n=1 Tax=Flavobacterium okayamense TaxID=2830782 RepID=A0ABM7S7I7_9FLAO|nr:hypothetical protein [Flavobacterium okayamense]BCY29503.1 hypothetical protein KK2020170_23710 [Flavobacterium okayamense]